MNLEGGERLVLKTLLDLQGEAGEYVEDARLAAAARMFVPDVRDWLETLEGKGLVERVRGTDGFSAYVTAKGKQALRLTEPIMTPNTPISVVPKAPASAPVSPSLHPIPKTPETTGPVRLFYSYSHKDEKLRVKLEEHLALLQRQGVIAGWHDRNIGAGDEWKGAIDKNLEEARVILLLVSSSFLASDYCWDVETKRAVERHDRGEAVVIPIIVRPCDWHGAPFAKLQSLPKDGKAVTSWSNRDEAWKDVASGVRRAVEQSLANDTHRTTTGPLNPVGTPGPPLTGDTHPIHKEIVPPTDNNPPVSPSPRTMVEAGRTGAGISPEVGAGSAESEIGRRSTDANAQSDVGGDSVKDIFVPVPGKWYVRPEGDSDAGWGLIGETPAVVPIEPGEEYRLEVAPSVADEDLVGLTRLQSIGSLRSLSLAGCERLTDAGLANLRSLSGLKEFEMGFLCFGITGAGLASLRGLSGLRRINLSFSHVTDAGLAHLRGLTGLRYLNLSCSSEVTDAGLAHLRGLTGLKDLALNDCENVTDYGLRQLSKLSGLENLDLNNCEKVTDHGVDRLIDDLPKCAVWWNR